jgi:hypothetical protein
LSQAQKQPSLKDFVTKIRTNAGLVPNLDYETRKIRIRIKHMQNKNLKRFYCNKKIRIKQGCEKTTYPKLMLNILKLMRNSTSIYTHWAPNSTMFLKKLPIYM